MNVVLLRIGIDTGSGGIHAPLFADRTFEYIPIPDGQAVDELFVQPSFSTLRPTFGDN
jgi:hypothetical protein